MTEKNVFSFVFNLRFMSDLHGWLVINIDENVICDLVNHSEYIQDGYILVADESGKVMSHMDKSVIGSNMGDAEYFQKLWARMSLPAFPAGYRGNKESHYLFEISLIWLGLYRHLFYEYVNDEFKLCYVQDKYCPVFPVGNRGRQCLYYQQQAASSTDDVN